jgi:hypothetical protein
MRYACIKKEGHFALFCSLCKAGLFSYFFRHVRDEDVYPALEALPARLITDYEGTGPAGA